jgi:hypothetical protein
MPRGSELREGRQGHAIQELGTNAAAPGAADRGGQDGAGADPIRAIEVAFRVLCDTDRRDLRQIGTPAARIRLFAAPVRPVR